MKLWIQEELEKVIEQYGHGQYEAYAENMWNKHKADCDILQDDYKYAYICGVYQAMLGGMLYDMKQALDKINELRGEDE
jgi:hypothetical protein